MLGLPASTEVNRRVAKEKLYANATLTTSVREAIKNQIEAVIWRNKLSDTTIGTAAGESVKEIQVFEIELRQKDLDRRILPVIAKAIPYKILFILTHDGEAQAWIETEGTFYHTDWFHLNGFTLKFDGLNLDAIYANLARQIAGGRLDDDTDIANAVQRDALRQKLEKDIAALIKKIGREKQFNRQVPLNEELKQLRKQLEELK